MCPAYSQSSLKADYPIGRSAFLFTERRTIVIIINAEKHRFFKMERCFIEFGVGLWYNINIRIRLSKI